MPASYSLLNTENMRAWIAMFRLCYVEGVKDAYKSSDAFSLDEFVRAKHRPGSFEPVNATRVCNWRTWRTWLNTMAMDLYNAYKSRIRHYLLQATNPLETESCVYPISYDFYLYGIRDFLDNPLADISKINIRTNHTCKSLKTKTARMCTDDIIALVQEFCFNREQYMLDYEAMDSSEKEEFIKSIGGMKYFLNIQPHKYALFGDGIWRILKAYRVNLKLKQIERREQLERYETLKYGLRTSGGDYAESLYKNYLNASPKADEDEDDV